MVRRQDQHEVTLNSVSIATPLRWTSSSYTHVGMVRKINEDAFIERPQLGLAGLWAVADGMGGHEAGDVASRLIMDNLQNIPAPTDLAEFIDATEASLQQANHLLQDKAARFYQRRTIGSTIVVLLLYQTQMACLWAGDSRLYRLRDGQLQQLTRDHSHVQELLDRGLISAAEAENHPMSNVITRAVGSAPELDVDKLSETVTTSDVFLLCSDGINRVVSDSKLAAIIANSQPQYAAQAIVNAALRNKADDNVTATVVTLNDTSNERTIPLSIVP